MSRIEQNNRSSITALPATKKSGKESSRILPSIQPEQIIDKDSILQTWEEIEQIRRENKELREEIETETRMNHQNGPVLEAKMEQIQDVSSAIAQRIEVESQKKRDLETLIGVTQENINLNLKKMNENNGIALPQLQAKIKALEYKLEKTRSRHNESLAQINMLKEQVNMARRERVIFSNVFKKLESDIKLRDEEFKKYMIEKMHVSEKKQALQQDLANIKARAKKEVQNFKSEYQSIFNQTKQQEPNNNSNSNDNNQEYSMANKRIFNTEINLNNDHSISNPKYPSILSSNLENTQMNNKSNLAHKSGLAQTSNHQSQNNSMSLQAAQEEKVQKEVGIDDLEQLIYLFENIDTENNELYEQANHKSDEIDDLEKQIKDVDKEILRYSRHKDPKQGITNDQDKHKLEVQRLQKKIKNTEMMTVSVDKDIQTVQTKLIKIADKFNVAKPSEDDTDGASFISFLAVVEKRINDIITMTLFSEGKVVNIDKHRDAQASMTSIKKDGRRDDISTVLDGVKKKSDNEAERILNKQDFNQTCQDEIKQFKDFKGKGNATTSKGKKVKL